jgi:hypothetical protein
MTGFLDCATAIKSQDPSPEYDDVPPSKQIVPESETQTLKEQKGAPLRKSVADIMLASDEHVTRAISSIYFWERKMIGYCGTTNSC